MGSNLAVVLLLLAGCVVLFVWGKPRMDVVAFLALVALTGFGIVSPQEGMAGFGDPSVILIAAMFVIGEGLVRTGIAFRVGDWLIATAGGSPTRLMVLLMAAVALMGSLMSSTGVVAIFVPIAMSACRKLKIPPGSVMMPLSFAGLISGMLTLVGTAPNLVVDSSLKREGFPGLGFFSLTPIGIAILVLGIAYMLVARKWLVQPVRAGSDGDDSRGFSHFIEEYDLAKRERRARILPGSPLIGKKVGGLNLRQTGNFNLIAIERGGGWTSELINPVSETELAEGDILFVDVNQKEKSGNLVETLGLEVLPLGGHYFSDQARQIGMAELLIPPESEVLGKSVKENEIRRQCAVHVIGLRRKGKPMPDPVNTPLQSGDILLVIGPWKSIRTMTRQNRNFLMLTVPAEAADYVPVGNKAAPALLSLAVMVTLMITGLVPNVTAAMIGCLMMGGFGCIDLKSAYRSIHWQSLFVIAGMMPFAVSLQRTGGVELAVKGVIQLLGDGGPSAILAALFLITTVIGLFISNTVTAVLMAPIAISIATQLGASPLAFGVVVAIASSTAFMTPVSSPVNMLVMGPGQYQFRDFLKVGVPFALLVLVVTVLLVPILFPLYP